MMMKLMRMRKRRKLTAAMTNRRAMGTIAIRTFLSDHESLLSTQLTYRGKSMRSKCR
jgi:hypothetical protein